MITLRRASSVLFRALKVLTLVLVASCGSNNNTNTTPPPPPPPPPPTNIGQGGCVPVTTAQIAFTATNIQFDSIILRGGQIPYGPTVGQITMGGGLGTGPYTATSADGTISMNISPIVPPQGQLPAQNYPCFTYPCYPNGGSGLTANATGVLTLSAQVQAEITQYANGGFLVNGNNGSYPFYPYYPYYPVPQPTPTTQLACVSGIAIDGSHVDYRINLTWIYVYVNNTSHGIKLFF